MPWLTAVGTQRQTLRDGILASPPRTDLFSRRQLFCPAGFRIIAALYMLRQSPSWAINTLLRRDSPQRLYSFTTMSSQNNFDSASDHRKQDLIEAYDRIHDRVQQAAQARTGSQQVIQRARDMLAWLSSAESCARSVSLLTASTGRCIQVETTWRYTGTVRTWCQTFRRELPSGIS